MTKPCLHDLLHVSIWRAIGDCILKNIQAAYMTEEAVKVEN